ncbi:hypothetical protein [Streptomyces sp. CC228A]|uniref:hypothetical protein n=1 Tax=Streptomyces sp. CC228A TaxID=2898186 RepID=UPI001F4909D8|nr:hypothetical protein [Streptomyces sp. CC228A]
MPELWTIDQVSEYLGIKPASARRQLGRWGIGPAEFRPHPVSRRAQALYPADDVQSAHRGRPGQGARSGQAPT